MQVRAAHAAPRLTPVPARIGRRSAVRLLRVPSNRVWSSACPQSKSTTCARSSAAARSVRAAPRRERVDALRGVSFEMAAASASPSSARTARASRRSSGCSRRCCCTTAGARRIFGHDVFRTRARCAGSSTASRSRPPSSRRCPSTENLRYAARFYGLTAGQTRDRIPRDPRARRLPGGAAQRGDGGSLARHAAEGRARPRAPDAADPAPARRADDGPRPALEARGPGLHPRDPRDARRDDPALHPRPRRGRGARRPRRDPRRRRAALPRAASTSSRRRYGADDARGGVLRRDRQADRGRESEKEDE